MSMSVYVPKRTELDRNALYLRGHRLLLQYEEYISAHRKIPTVKDETLRPQIKQASRLITRMRDLMKTTHNLTLSIPSGPCYLSNKPQTEHTQQTAARIASQRMRIDLKKIGNQLLHEKLKDVRSGIALPALKKRVAYLEHTYARDVRKQQDDLLRARIKQIRERQKQDLSAIAERRNKLVAERQGLKNATNHLAKVKEVQAQRYADEKRKLVEERKTYQLLLEQCKKGLVQTASAMLPVRKDPKDPSVTSICGVALPNSGHYAHIDTDRLSAALGNTIRLVMVLSKYLSVCLPYAMRFLCSHSEVSENDSSYRVSDETERETALKLLNENISALCYSQGLVFSKPSKRGAPQRHTLYNLHKLLHWPHVGSEVPECTVVDSYIPAEGEEAQGDDSHDEDGFVLLEESAPPKPFEDDNLKHWERANMDNNVYT
mmetsp:Transcript_13551/g.14968  ORF Transcript_13551/g.14968 Transcript_13551/m.14968 type:complete len:432 (-) Transcript_13551:46-1341(-)